MLVAAALSFWIKPNLKLADKDPIRIDRAVPVAFGNWAAVSAPVSYVVNPVQEKELKQLYSQTLIRIYENRKTGYRVMLSIAYGEDQRDEKQLHYPEICYPAQGFSVVANAVGILPVGKGEIPVRRLVTQLGATRIEPVTYWTMIGRFPVMRGLDKRAAELKYSLKGLIADGIVFRVSSVDADNRRAFEVQQGFVQGLLMAAVPKDRNRLSGL